jgi:putative hemolysin
VNDETGVHSNEEVKKKKVVDALWNGRFSRSEQMPSGIVNWNFGCTSVFKFKVTVAAIITASHNPPRNSD